MLETRLSNDTANAVIHVAFVVTRFEMGGLERCIARVVNGIDTKRFRVSIICLDRAGSAVEWLEKADVPIIELRKGKGNSLAVVKLLSEVCRSHEIDVLQSHNWGTLLEATIASKWANKRVSHIHAERGSVLGSEGAHGVRWLVRKWVMRWCVKRCRRITTNSLRVANTIRSLTGIGTDQITIIPNGVDLPVSFDALQANRRKLRTTLGIPENGVLLGSVGRLVAVKNFQFAIESFAALSKDSRIPVYMVLVGDGPESADLQALSNKLGVADRVFFAGAQANVWPHLAAMDIYINTSLSEGMSQSMLEAMAAGKPVVASDVGDAQHMLGAGEVCGLTYPSGNSSVYLESISQLIQNVDQRRRFAANALSKHQRIYSNASMVRGFEGMYSQIVRAAENK